MEVNCHRVAKLLFVNGLGRAKNVRQIAPPVRQGGEYFWFSMAFFHCFALNMALQSTLKRDN